MTALTVVGTPIGNLGDVSERALLALREADLIAAEDTRVTRKLLSRFDIHTRAVSYHAHNEEGRAEQLVARMTREELSVALVSDAGMPTISDPGAVLVRRALEAGIPVTCVPGPSAVATALALTGWDIPAYAFWGFLPRSEGARRERLLFMAGSGVPLGVCYESPFRVLELMRSVTATLPGVQVCACCDLTKKFELVLRGPAEQVLSQMEANPNTEKGEYCLVLDFRGALLPEKDVETTGAEHFSLEARLVQRMVEAGEDLQAAAESLKALGEKRNAVYQAVLRLKDLL